MNNFILPGALRPLSCSVTVPFQGWLRSHGVKLPWNPPGIAIRMFPTLSAGTPSTRSAAPGEGTAAADRVSKWPPDPQDHRFALINPTRGMAVGKGGFARELFARVRR